MTKRIYKYPFSYLRTEPTAFILPPSAKVISVGLDQQDQLCFWAEVDTSDMGNSQIVLQLVFTGDEPPADGRFLATVRMPDGVLMVHVYVLE